MSIAAPALYGLVLAGGSSSRMRRDKAALLYRGRTQLERAVELAGRHVSQVFVSVRPEQIGDPTRSRLPLIVDSVEGEGPLAGIRSAFGKHSDVGWLVLACDLPFLSDDVLRRLVTERDPGAMATAYASAHDGLVEPLCAIWEPAAAAALAIYQREGGRCPRKFLATATVRLLEPLDPRALDNINTPEEYQNALQALDERRLKIQYFALLREQAGRSEETLLTSAATPAALFSEVSKRHGFTLPQHLLKVAVNGEFADWSHPLAAGDAVVFIPPVAGG